MIRIFLCLTLLISVAAIIVSCKKERSCEGCHDRNKLPLAVAGPDQVIALPTDSILLDGSASSDPDGTITQWRWQKISGPHSLAIVSTFKEKTIVRSLVAGTYHFELKVTDDKNASTTDTMIVVVNVAGVTNHPPVADAGPDQAITLPANTVALDGSASKDPDNNITSYTWTKISGPSSFNIINTNRVQTQANDLAEGVYLFELKVTDAGGLSHRDTVQVSVVRQGVACTNCKIVFVSNRDGNREIYTCNPDGSNIQRLTNDPGTDEEPVWSPDGTRIAFISDRSGFAHLYIMNADGSGVVRRTFSGNHHQSPTWSPDGSKIAYSTLSNGSANLWVVGPVTGSPSLLFGTPGWDSQPTWSPDGTKIAFISDWAAYDFVYDIYTVDANGSGFTALTVSGNIVDSVDYFYPRWSPNGTKLAMAVGKLIGIGRYDTKIGVVNPDGSNLKVIALDAADWSKTSWSRDGARIVYTSLVGSRMDVSWISADGSAKGTIVANAWNADWQH